MRHLMLMLILGCGGADSAPDGACREHADCDSEEQESCFTQDDVWCGACEDAEIGCEQPGDCGDGEVCASTPLACPCDVEASTACVPRCTAEACGAGETCDDDSGLCVVTPCTDSGDACPAFHDCVPGGPGDGCVRAVCSADADCGEGYCVRGACYAEPGFCDPGPE